MLLAVDCQLKRGNWRRRGWNGRRGKRGAVWRQTGQQLHRIPEPQRGQRPSPTPLRPLEVIASTWVRGHMSGVSSSSGSFKALLLRKGSRCDSGARMSAAERLRSTAPKHQSPPPHSQSQSDTHLQLGVKSHTHTPHPSPHTHTVQVQLPSLEVPQTQYRQRHRRKEEWAITERLFPLPFSSSPSSPSLWAWRPPPPPPRSPTPPCSASRRFAACTRLPSSSMTAIQEQEGEGDGESLESEGLSETIKLDHDSHKTFGLVKLSDG
uniref:NHS-like protein 1 n=1 Tax=Oncorhynchus gorbuscha TaxID=8017 RepID=UPI001EAF34CB|nr:NHS-like protein 1 [Oncorhynchus gorbuscha]